MSDKRSYKNPIFPFSLTGPESVQKTLNENSSRPFVLPKGKNSVPSLAVLHSDRTYYSDYVVPLIKAQILDKSIFCNLLETNVLYGKIDSNLNIIIPVQNRELMKEVFSFDKKPKLVISFVADAFNEMSDYLRKAVAVRKISPNGVYSDLRAHKAFTPLQDVLSEVQQKHATEFFADMVTNLEKSSKIIDPKSFNKIFIDTLLQNINLDIPVTYSGIIISTGFSKHINALTIDIATDKADDDKNKVEKYFFNKDFSVFADACKRHGFLIDVNVPWRIVPDFNSPAMMQVTEKHTGYLLRYDMNNLDDLFNTRYKLAIGEDVNYLKKFFYNMYSIFLKETPVYEKDYKNTPICELRQNERYCARQSVSEEEYYKLFPDTYWLRLYLYFKNQEEKLSLSQQQFENIVREANNYVKIGKQIEGYLFVNNYVKSFKNVKFISSLQPIKDVVQQIAEKKSVTKLVF